MTKRPHVSQLSHISENTPVQKKLELALIEVSVLSDKLEILEELVHTMVEENESKRAKMSIRMLEIGKIETIEMNKKRYGFMKENIVDMYTRSLNTDTNKKIEDCPVCLEHLTGLTMLVLDCGHYMCRDCYPVVENAHNKCPVCRYKLKTEYVVISPYREDDDDDEEEAEEDEEDDEDEEEEEEEEEDDDDDDDDEEDDDDDSEDSESDSDSIVFIPLDNM